MLVCFTIMKSAKVDDKKLQLSMCCKCFPTLQICGHPDRKQMRLRDFHQRGEVRSGSFGKTQEARVSGCEKSFCKKTFYDRPDWKRIVKMECDALLLVRGNPHVPFVVCGMENVVVTYPYCKLSFEQFWDKVPGNQVLRQLRCMVNTLAMLDEKRIKHRDICPENIRYTSEGCFYLLDFGLAKQENTHSKLEVRGNEFYVAPDSSASHKWDVFVLGLVMVSALRIHLKRNNLMLSLFARQQGAAVIWEPLSKLYIFFCQRAEIIFCVVITVLLVELERAMSVDMKLILPTIKRMLDCERENRCTAGDASLALDELGLADCSCDSSSFGWSEEQRELNEEEQAEKELDLAEELLWQQRRVVALNVVILDDKRKLAEHRGELEATKAKVRSLEREIAKKRDEAAEEDAADEAEQPKGSKKRSRK